MLLDKIFGRDCFLNEIIWAYDYGGRPKNRWPPKHDNILFYVKDPANYFFNYDEIERIPYMAPGLVGPEKAARGSCRPTPGGTPSSRQRQGENRIPNAETARNPAPIVGIVAPRRPGGGFLRGQRTTGAACLKIGRRFILIDDNPKAIEVMQRRFAEVADIEWRAGQSTRRKTNDEGRRNTPDHAIRNTNTNTE